MPEAKGSLRLFFRIRQRQHSDPNDYFDSIRAKYADAGLRFYPSTTYYVPLSPAAVQDAKDQHFMIADTTPHKSLVIQEMIGELDVSDEDEARDIALNSDADHCYAEYVVPYRIEKEPE